MNITITGNLGSGKSTVCKELAKIDYQIISTGTIFREIAKERGLSVVELNEEVNREIAAGKHDIDDMIDNRSKRLGDELDNAVFDSRLAWNFVNDSFKVFLTVDINEAAARVFNDNRDTETYASVQECKKALLDRQLLEQERFEKLYGIDYYNMNNYNLVLETTNAKPETIAAEILKRFEEYKQQKFKQIMLLNPTSVYPTESIGEVQEYALSQSAMEEKSSYQTIEVGMKNIEWYVLDGQKKLLEAICKEQPFIYAVAGKKEVPSADKSLIHDFEKIGQFQYKKYPVEQDEKNLIHFEAAF